MLDSGGVFGLRSFDIKQGDLTIGQGETVQGADGQHLARQTAVLTVDGTIDASGATPGTIDLAASGNLELDSTSVLDAHGTVLQVDSNGQPIDAENVGTVNLATTNGTLTLDPRRRHRCKRHRAERRPAGFPGRCRTQCSAYRHAPAP